MKTIVYEGFQHFIPTGEGWAKGLEELGHVVYRLPSTQYRIAEVDEDVDLMIIHDINIDDIIAYKTVHPKTKVAILHPYYDPHVFRKLKPYVDLWFNLGIKNSFFTKYMEMEGMKYRPISLAAHSSYAFPMEVEKSYDVSFFGQIGQQGHGYRNEDVYLYPVIEKGYKSAFGGFKWYPPLHHSKLNEVYNRTKVNLNFHYSNQKAESPEDGLSRIELNGRVFEIALSGNFQISDHPFISEAFGDAIPYVKPEDWIKTIDYYLAHDDERNALAQKARTIALEKHTYACRAKQILQEVGL